MNLENIKTIKIVSIIQNTILVNLKLNLKPNNNPK